MAIQLSRRPAPAGVKCIMSALSHRRGDRYLFANPSVYGGKSYRSLWLASRSTDRFEVWLRKKGIVIA